MAGNSYKLKFGLSDGTTKEVTFTAPQGPQGIQGTQGIQGPQGLKGDTGAKGADGHTPVRGTDYWTEADQESIVQQVITALGTPVFGTVDENKVITLTGDLAAGTYTLKYEDADGNATAIGSLSIEGEPTYTNMLKLAVDSSGAPYTGENGEVGYKANYRVNSSGVETSHDGTYVTGFIPATVADKIYLYDIVASGNDTTRKQRVAIYDDAFEYLGYIDICAIYSKKDVSQVASEGVAFDEGGNLTAFTAHALRYWLSIAVVNKTAYVRIVAGSITSASVITKNEEIS